MEAKAKGHCPEELMQRLVTDLTAWETASGTRKNIRRNGLEKLRAAVAAFVADLLHARNHPEAKGWVYRSLSKESFSRHAVSFRDFKSIVKTWTARGLLERKPGYMPTIELDPGETVRTRGKASRFRARPELLLVCAEHGITPQNAGEHFHYPPPEHPLVLKAASRRDGPWKEAGRVMKFDRTPRTEAPRTERQETERLPWSARHPRSDT